MDLCGWLSVVVGLCWLVICSWLLDVWGSYRSWLIVPWLLIVVCLLALVIGCWFLMVVGGWFGLVIRSW